MNFREDLIYNNSFIPSYGAPQPNYDMSAEARRQALRGHVEYQRAREPLESLEPVVERDFRKSNLVMDEHGQPRNLDDRVVYKEQRRILSINSSERIKYKYEAVASQPEGQGGGPGGADTPYIPAYTYNKYIQYLQQPDYADFIFCCENFNSKPLSTPSSGATAIGCTAGIQLLVVADSLPDTGMSSLNTIAESNIVLIDRLNAIISANNRGNIFPDIPWTPFALSQNRLTAYELSYNEYSPARYTVTFPKINHVKSIRVLSTEVPNTIRNITDKNNIIVLKLVDTTNPTECILPPNSPFNFILVLLDVGIYTIQSLVTHLQAKLNAAIVGISPLPIFEVSFNSITGEFTINLSDSIGVPSTRYTFHLKFYMNALDFSSKLIVPYVGGAKISNVYDPTLNEIDTRGELWYKLGFPSGFEINSNGLDHYTTSMTNLLNVGINPILDPAKYGLISDIFDRNATALGGTGATGPYSDWTTITTTLAGGTAAVQSTFSPAYTAIYRPYKYPDMTVRYIYLLLTGYNNMYHASPNNKNIWTKSNILTKVQLNVSPGEMTYNTFVDNPFFFDNIKDNIDTLEFTWLDDTGNQVDFGNTDHSFTLEFITYTKQSDLNSYSSQFGIIDKKSYPDYLSTR